MESCLSESLHPAAPHHLPSFITAPGDTDILMVVVGIVLIGAVLAVGNLYLHLHTLPERMAQRKSFNLRSWRCWVCWRYLRTTICFG
jgi:apolipoprotein N-acyltransferase